VKGGELVDVPDGMGLIRALLYGVQFDENLLDGVNRTLELVVARSALGASPAEYLKAIRVALASKIELSKLLPLALDHSEAQVREYLIEIARRLEADGVC
jgi:hypothetical protein